MTIPNPDPDETYIPALSGYRPNKWTQYRSSGDAVWMHLRCKPMDNDILLDYIPADLYSGRTTRATTNEGRALEEFYIRFGTSNLYYGYNTMFDLYTGYQVNAYHRIRGTWNAILGPPYGGWPKYDRFYAFLTDPTEPFPAHYPPPVWPGSLVYDWFDETKVLGETFGYCGRSYSVGSQFRINALGNYRRFRYYGSAFGGVKWHGEVNNRVDNYLSFMSAGYRWWDYHTYTGTFTFGTRRVVEAGFWTPVFVSRFGEETLSESYEDLSPEFLNSLVTTEPEDAYGWMPGTNDLYTTDWELLTRNSTSTILSPPPHRVPDRKVKFSSLNVDVQAYRLVVRAYGNKIISDGIDEENSGTFRVYHSTTSPSPAYPWDTWTGTQVLTIECSYDTPTAGTFPFGTTQNSNVTGLTITGPSVTSVVARTDPADAGLAQDIPADKWYEVGWPMSGVVAHSTPYLTYEVYGLDPYSMAQGNYVELQTIPEHYFNPPGFITNMTDGESSPQGPYHQESWLWVSYRWEALVKFPSFKWVDVPPYTEVPPLRMRQRDDGDGIEKHPRMSTDRQRFSSRQDSNRLPDGKTYW